jgi:VWFA-related protein
VTVTDSIGVPVHNLGEADFIVSSAAKRLPVVFSHEDSNGIPTSVLVVIDTSGSMEPKLQMVRWRIQDLILGLNICDDVGLLAFSDQAVPLQALTTDHYLTARRLDSLSPYGGTGLYDAIVASAHLISQGKYPDRAIILVTDGIDNVSHASMTDALKALVDNNVQVDIIGIGTPSLMISRVLLPLGIPIRHSADKTVLDGLAARTGGVDYIVATASKPEEFSRAASKVQDALGPVYDLGFTSGPGTFEQPTITVAHHPDYAVQIIEVPTGSSVVNLHPKVAKH